MTITLLNNKYMKQISFFIAFLAVTSLSAQNSGLTSVRNYFRGGDKLTKQQVEFKDPGSSGKDIEWDFSMLNSIDEKYGLAYFGIAEGDTAHIIGTEHDTHYYYQLKNDTLLLVGYDNRTTQMNFDRPEAQLCYPFRYGDSLRTTFSGKGQYCQKVDLVAQGETTATVDATGMIITPTKDTINNVLRVKRLRSYTQIGVDSVRMQLETYSWYAQGYRYPVFETVKSMILRGDSTTESFSTSFYYPIEDMRNLPPDPANENIASDKSTNIYSIFTEARLMPNPVTDNLYINYKLTRAARVWFTVHNNIGIPLCQTAPQDLSEGYQSATINMGNLITGTYSLYVHVDDMVMRQMIIKR
jgi:hypothetical protein